MAQDVKAQQDEPSNSCCAELQKKHSELLKKFAKREAVKNQFRDCAKSLSNKCDEIEKEKACLEKALEELKVQANVWKDEKDQEAGRRIDLEDEVSALQDEVQSLKQSSSSASQGVDGQLQGRIAQAEEEIKHLKELLDQERGKVASEKKNAALEKKKADEALKKLEMGRNKISEAQKVANAERKKAEENRLLWEKLKKETDDMKSVLALEKSKSVDAEKKVEAEKQKATRERKRADVAMAKSEEQQKLAETSLKKSSLEKDRAYDLNRKLEQAMNKAEQLEGELLKHKCPEKSEDKLKKEIDDLKSMLTLERCKSEAAHKKVEVEKQKAIGERKKADLAVVKSKEQKELAKTNLKKAMFEKDRADELSRKLEEARTKAEKLELELHKHISSEVQTDKSNTVRNAVPTTDVSLAMLQKDTPFSSWMEKILLEKEHNIAREKKCADSAKKKAKKQTEAAEEYKKIAMEQKNRADELSGQLEKYKLRLEELQKELQEFVSWKIYASNAPIRNNDVIFESNTVKLLKKQLKLEKLLAKHAKEATKVEVFRNKMLEQKLCHLKKETLQYQHCLNILDKRFLHAPEGIDQLEKFGGQTNKREILGSDGHHRRLMSGTDSRMDPPYRGSNQKMLKSSAINSSSASFSDRPLVGSQERGTLSIMASTNLEEDISNFKPKLSEKKRTSYYKHDLAKADNKTRSSIEDSPSKRRVASCDNKMILGVVESIEKLHTKDENLHEQMSEKLSLLHDILDGQMDEPDEESLKEISCGQIFRPLKKRKTSSEGTVTIHRLQDSKESKGMSDSDACMPSSPGRDAIRSNSGFEDGTNNIYGQNLGIPQHFDLMITDNYMKLLEMDNAADEDSYCRAISRPLSPMLPAVEFHMDEGLEGGIFEVLVHRSSQDGLSNVRDNPTIFETEKNPTNLVSNGSVPSQLQMKPNSFDFSKDMASLAASDTHRQEIHVTSGKLEMSNLSCSGNDGTVESFENETVSTHCGMLKCFVVFSDNKDNSSILRVLQTICSFMPECSFGHSIEIFLQNIIHTLSKAKDLSTREKACVFLSLILHKFSGLGFKNLTNGLDDNLVQSLRSVSMYFSSALSDPASKRMLMLCDLSELLVLIEDLLMQRKVFVCGSVSAESESLVTSKLNLILNDNPIILLEVAASAHMLVAGGILLASLCSVADQIGFVCEISCSIIRMQKLDPPVMLAILHAFAHICGSKYFTIQQYSIAMTVVKSSVMFLEKQILSANTTSFSPSDVGNSSSILLCTNCPFSAGAIPVEDVALLLLENLRNQCQCGSWPQDSLVLVNLLDPKLWPHEEGTEEVSGLGKGAPLSSTCDENLCNFLDIISLVEVLASVMSWDWTSDHLIGQFCEFLELHLLDGFSAALIILLGQLGRLGVGAGGYEDSGVQKLRGWLSRFACEITFKKLSLSLQFAIITSLLGVTPIKLEEIAEGKIETQAAMGEAVPCSFIRAWFFSLNCEQQSFLRLHLASK